MPSAILCSMPAQGHVRPMLAVATGLLARGWRVRFLTGAAFEEKVRTAGVEFLELPAEADSLHRRAGDERHSGIASLNHGIKQIFFDPAPAEFRAAPRRAPGRTRRCRPARHDIPWHGGTSRLALRHTPCGTPRPSTYRNRAPTWPSSLSWLGHAGPSTTHQYPEVGCPVLWCFKEFVESLLRESVTHLRYSTGIYWVPGPRHNPSGKYSRLSGRAGAAHPTITRVEATTDPHTAPLTRSPER